MKFSHIHEQYFPQSSEELLAHLREYLAQIYVTSPASAALNAGALEHAAGHSSLILDGSFGEIARRQCFNRLLIKGSKALRQRTADRMIQYMTIQRAAIFNRETVEAMERGFVRQMQWYLMRQLHIGSMSDEDFADLMTIHTRFPNYSGVEQARTDAFMIKLYAFPAAFGPRECFLHSYASQEKRQTLPKNNYQNCPELASFPLVKGGTTYPFRF